MRAAEALSLGLFKRAIWRRGGGGGGEGGGGRGVAANGRAWEWTGMLVDNVFWVGMWS